MDKGLCQSCNRKIQNTVFDQCMYCGAVLAIEQKFTDSEKSNIKNNQKKRNQRSIDSSTGIGSFNNISNSIDFSD